MKRPTKTTPEESADHIDRLRAQWELELPDLDTQPMSVLGRVYRLSNLVRPSIEETFAQFGVDRGEFDVLSTLLRSGAPYRLIPTQLYRSLMISSGGLTHRLARLERAGLITRIPDARDGRSLAVELTAQGHAITEAAFRADMTNEAQFLTGLTSVELETLAALLRKLHRTIETRVTAPNADLA